MKDERLPDTAETEEQGHTKNKEENRKNLRIGKIDYVRKADEEDIHKWRGKCSNKETDERK